VPPPLNLNVRPLGMHSKTRWAVIIFGPLLATTIYFIVSRWPNDWATGSFDFLAIGVAVCAGLWAIARLNLSTKAKLTIGALYAPLAFAALGFYSLAFVCAVFDNCL
jgi:hypothetical protein